MTLSLDPRRDRLAFLLNFFIATVYCFGYNRQFIDTIRLCAAPAGLVRRRNRQTRKDDSPARRVGRTEKMHLEKKKKEEAQT